MAKKKEVSKRSVNQYPHNLNKHTIITDRNSFNVKGQRYTISGDNIINITTKEVYTVDWQKVKDYF